MEKSSFFNSVSGDRKYSAEDWAAYFASFVSNGVFGKPSTSLQVVASTGMNVTIKAGSGFINGYFYRNTSDMTKLLAVANGSSARIDRIVLRWSLSNRNITICVKTGTPANSPSAPALTRTADTYEIALADVRVGAGVTTIAQSVIQDRRASSSLCGIVTSAIQQLDVSSFAAQFEAFQAGWETSAMALLQQYQTAISQTGSQVIPDLSVTRVKLASDALYSPISNASASRAITASDLGKTVSANASGVDFNFTLSKAEFDSWPTGFEFALCWVRGNSVKLSTDTGLYVAHENYPEFFTGNITNAKVVLSNRFSMVAFKKVSSNVIFITGSVEVTT